MKYAKITDPLEGVKFIGKKKVKRSVNRAKLVRNTKKAKKRRLTAYVGSNIERMWWGNKPMTPNLWRKE